MRGIYQLSQKELASRNGKKIREMTYFIEWIFPWNWIMSGECNAILKAPTYKMLVLCSSLCKVRFFTIKSLFSRSGIRSESDRDFSWKSCKELKRRNFSCTLSRSRNKNRSAQTWKRLHLYQSLIFLWPTCAQCTFSLTDLMFSWRQTKT